jgi:hypothetical protein
MAFNAKMSVTIVQLLCLIEEVICTRGNSLWPGGEGGVAKIPAVADRGTTPPSFLSQRLA